MTTTNTIPEQPSLPPDTTLAEDVMHAGQRRINLLWETTQAIISITITLAAIYASIAQINSAELSNGFFLIIGFYFSRTNHTRIGGIGTKSTDAQLYQGR